MSELGSVGFVLRQGVVTEEGRRRLLALSDPDRSPAAVRHPSGNTYAARGLLWSVPSLRSELANCGLDALASAALGRAGFPIDAIFFDKQTDANWAVPGHQDRLMPVAGPVPERGRVRAGISYVEPSPEVLAGLVAVRIHFDACNEETGGLCLVAGSHLGGVLSDTEINAVPLERYRPCAASPGDVLIMRPLVLHRSSPSRGSAHRRVLHVVYAGEQPSDGLRWRSFELP